MFVDQLLLEDMFSQLYSLCTNLCQNQQWRASAIHRKNKKNNNTDLTQSFSSSIFTDFRYQSIKLP